MLDSGLKRPEAARQPRTSGGDKPLTGKQLELTAETFRILADPTRLRIIDALQRQELCVAELAALVGSSESAVSHHLRHLRLARLVRTRRDGRLVYYRLDDDHVATLVNIGIEHVRETLD